MVVPLMAVMRPLALGTVLLLVHSVGAAGELVDHFERARGYDPLFQAARAERDANTVASRVARAALYPELRLSTAQLETENTTRTTVAVVQPLVDATRYATFREGPPREVLAAATFQSREQELAQRYFTAVAELVRARESLALNQARIEALDEQARSARRGFELGTGTITDLRDAQVRLDQARAADITLRAQLSAAERRFAGVTGTRPAPGAFTLVRKAPEFTLALSDSDVEQAMGENPQLVAARQNTQLAELGVTRAKGVFVPVLNLTATRTQAGGESNNFVGVQLSFPLAVGSVLQVSGAIANATRFAEQARDLEQQNRLEIARLHELVQAGRQEVAIRLEGIRSAELSVEATEKSFRGGVRNKLDTINSILTLHQVREEYLNAVLRLAENMLNLHMRLARPIPESLRQIEQVLFIPA